MHNVLNNILRYQNWCFRALRSPEGWHEQSHYNKIGENNNKKKY